LTEQTQVRSSWRQAGDPNEPRPTTLADAVRSEYAKFTSVQVLGRVTAVAVAMASVFAVVFCVSIPVTQGSAIADMRPAEVVSAGLLGIDVAAVVLVVLGAMFVGQEYSSGSIEQAFIVTPRRARVLAAKTLIIAPIAAGVGIAAALVGLLIGGAVCALAGSDAGAAYTPTTWRLAAGSVAMPMVYAPLGVFAAFVFRSTSGGVLVPAAVGVLGGIFGWLPAPVAGWLVPLLPLAAVHTLSGAAQPGGPEDMGIVPALLSLTLWLVVPYLIARWHLLREDV
jgi:ABC-2 type transport system permease protein